MIKYTPKYQVKVGGKMSEKDAGIVGKRLALSANIAAIGVFLFGLSFVLKLFL